jgi:hypothetical protein
MIGEAEVVIFNPVSLVHIQQQLVNPAAQDREVLIDYTIKALTVGSEQPVGPAFPSCVVNHHCGHMHGDAG